MVFSKYLFRNWFSAYIKYLLFARYRRSEYGTIVVICRDGYHIALPSRLFKLILDGFSNNIFRGLKCKEGVVIAKNFVVPLKELLNSDAVLEAIRWGWKYDHMHGYWFKGDVKFKHMRVSIIEVFDYEHYSFMNVKNKIVVDVGAYIGDSAIYFALKGAEKVIAIEPHPSAFNEMLENIRLNNLEDRIIPINASMSRNHGRICIKNVNVVETWSTYHRVDECSEGVPSITLSDVINSYGIHRGAVLKMDCEEPLIGFISTSKPKLSKNLFSSL